MLAMLNYFSRAKSVYDERGSLELLRSFMIYCPRITNNIIFRVRNGEGVNVMDEDWDTLVILDACRYDSFQDINIPFDGELQFRISQGSKSDEFLDKNFSNGKFHNTVYLSGNGYISELGLDSDGTFYHSINVWNNSMDEIPPRQVTEEAIKTHKEFPNKRIIVHYMQPHQPFLGEIGEKLHKKYSVDNIIKFAEEKKIPKEDIWNAYEENIQIALNHVSQLIETITGKVVITADHGEMIGERQGPIPTSKIWGHPWGVRTPELIKVPWYIYSSGERRDIIEEKPVTSSSVSDEKVTQQLEALGYR